MAKFYGCIKRQPPEGDGKWFLHLNIFYVAKAWGILEFDSLFNMFLWNGSIFSFHLSVSFRIFKWHFLYFDRVISNCPSWLGYLVKKKEPVEPENNSEKKKKVAHSQWNEKIDQFHKNTFEIMNQNLKFPMPLPHKMCLVKNIIYHLPLVVGFRCKNKKK